MVIIYKKGLFYFLIIALVVLLQGCGKQKAQDAEAVILSEDVTYEGKDIILQGLKGEVQQYSMKDGTLYVLTRQQEDSHLYKAAIDGSAIVEISVSLSKNARVNSFYVDGDNDILCLVSAENTDGQMELVKLNAEGKEIVRTELQELLPLTGENLLNRITVDGLGNIILASGSTVYSLSAELQFMNKISVKEHYEIISFIRTKSGEVACCIGGKDKDGESGELCILDTGKWKWGSFLQMATEPWIDEYCLMEGQEYDFYYKDGFGIYGYNSGENSWTKVLDARCSLLTAKDIDGMSREEKGQFLGMLSGSKNSEDGFALELYSKMKPEELENKKIITFAGYNVQDPLRTVAREFNKTHKDCRVEIEIYEDEDHTRLALDIATGRVPDIFLPSDMQIPMEQWVRKGILEDLTPYYEKDTEICMEDVIPSVLEGMKVEDKLYYVAPYFSIWSAACRTNDAGGKEGWNLEEMKETLEKKGEGAIAFETPEKNEMLFEFLISSLSEFINWETGECDFCSQEFKDILEFCNGGILAEPMTDNELYDQLEEIETKMQEGKVLLSVDQSIALDNIQLARQKFGSDITYIGIPEKDRQGSYFVYQDQYAIYSGSNVKEEAWEFIRMVMSEEYQINVKLLNFAIFPTRKDCLEWMLQAQMATEPYEDAYGNWIEPIETNIWQTESGAERKTGPASQEDVDILLDLIRRTKKQAKLDNEGALIISEEAQAYFYGEKSLDEVAKIIQKRMTTYVNEQW